MQNIITKVEELRDKFNSVYALEENAYQRACDDVIDILQNLPQCNVSGSLPTDGAPLMIWANVYNPIKPDSWDLHHTENSAVYNAIGGVKTHCYIHESVLGNDR